jgi:ABC-type uncharacterized transport system auxiliary subunit
VERHHCFVSDLSPQHLASNLSDHYQDTGSFRFLVAVGENESIKRDLSQDFKSFMISNEPC